MKFDKFAITSMKIKSNWFDGDRSIFNQIGKEEGLNLYIQFFRYRLHQPNGEGVENYQQHIFRLTVGELSQYTKVNCKRKLSHKKTLDILKSMTKAGIVKLHTPSRWSELLDDEYKVKSDKLIVLEATDVPNTHVVINDKGKEEDTPVTDNNWYIPINFKMIDYLYDTLGLTSKDVSVYFLILKLSSGGERKATININTMKEWLGYGNETITEILRTLNQNGVVASSVKRVNKQRISYEHVPVRSYSTIEKFKRDSKGTRINFLKRYKNTTEDIVEVNDNPFLNLDDYAINDSWLDETGESDWGTMPMKFDQLENVI